MSERGRQAKPLSESEFNVLCLIAKGRTKAQVAEELGRSENTVRTHISHIFAKLGAKTLAHAVALAFLDGVLRPPAQTPRPPLLEQAEGLTLPEQADLVRSWLMSGRARELRVAAGVSRAQLAAKVGCSEYSLGKWETCRRSPTPALVGAYYKCLAVLAAREESAARLDLSA